LNNLLLPNIDTLNKIAPKGDWHEAKHIGELLPIISKYDQDSSYFRYPITKNNFLDSEKFTMQQFKSKSLEGMAEEFKKQEANTKEGTFTMLLVDSNDDIVDAYKHNGNILADVRDALKEVAFYFHCIHIMTRMTLCGGM
jgi:hypothetical protein